MQGQGSSNGALNRPSEVIYQIYPASFKDSNGDGIGDLNGITQKLDYVAKLGADAIWISPIFLSPPGEDGDGGYAITDYRKIDPRFGTMDDFKKLLKKAHEKGLRVYTDFVLCHTAHDHKWFEASRDPNHPDHEKYKNHYVWADGRPRNGGLPSNWQSVFNGKPAWTWDDKRKKFYLHHFNKSQPTLNLNDAKVQEDSREEMKFWLDMGVDGLRLDALPYANYDPSGQFRDNTERGHMVPRDPEWWTRWGSQNFDHSMCQDQTHEKVLPAIRALADSYPRKKTIIAEAIAGKWGGDGDVEQAAKYLDPKTGAHSAYTNAWIRLSYDGYPPAEKLRDMIKENIKYSPDGGFCNNLGNHDFPRVGRILKNVDPAWHNTVMKQFMLLAASMPGSLCLYNGDELGLDDAKKWELGDKKRDLLNGDANRDSCRTPIPWEVDDKHCAGFSKASMDKLYLPVPERHLTKAADKQEYETGSMLQVTRRVLHQRKQNPALNRGRTIFLETYDPIVAFVRETPDQAVLCAFNMSKQEKEHFIPSKAKGMTPELLKKIGLKEGQEVHIPPYGSAFHGLYHDLELADDEVEIGMKPSIPPTANGKVEANGMNGHRPKRIFAVDMLFADKHIAGEAVEAVLRKYHRSKGKKDVISKEEYEELLAAYGHRPEITAGGSTACTLWTLKELLRDETAINLMGFAGDDDGGRTIKIFLSSAGFNPEGGSSSRNKGVNLIPPEWPADVPQETAITIVIKHDDKQNTILTYPGTEEQAFQKEWGKKRTATLLEEKIKQSDIIFLPESIMGKVGLTFTQELLKLRWEKKKELVLSLPSQAIFGPSDYEEFKKWIPSCNVVMGNDIEFCRILLGEDKTRQTMTEDDIRRIVKELQNGFQGEILKKVGIPCSKHGQVAFITRGNKKALLVTKDKVMEIEPERVKPAQISSRLGLGYAAFAGFLAGYVKGLSHEESAHLAMGLAGEKAKEGGPEPHLIQPEQALRRLRDPGHDDDTRKAAERFIISRKTALSGSRPDWPGH